MTSLTPVEIPDDMVESMRKILSPNSYRNGFKSDIEKGLNSLNTALAELDEVEKINSEVNDMPVGSAVREYFTKHLDSGSYVVERKEGRRKVKKTIHYDRGTRLSKMMEEAGDHVNSARNSFTYVFNKKEWSSRMFNQKTVESYIEEIKDKIKNDEELIRKSRDKADSSRVSVWSDGWKSEYGEQPDMPEDFMQVL